MSIGIVTALQEEYRACVDVFDAGADENEFTWRATTGLVRFRVSQIATRRPGGNHVVAITLLSDMGNNSAAIAANVLLQHCPKIRYLLMCGVAGAVPNPDDSEEHVRLGDIVVLSSHGIIQYDRGKQRDPRLSAMAGATDQPDPLAGFELRSPARPPSRELLDTINHMHADELGLSKDEFRPWETHINRFMERCRAPENWKRPYPNKDKLDDSLDGKGPRTSHPPDDRRRRVGQVRYPRVFHGPIGSANVVQADPARREALRVKHRLKAIEMEGSGIADVAWMAGIGYLVIRGTCDYCNTTKNHGWHNYAAVVAAGYTRAVVEYLPPENLPSTHAHVTPSSPALGDIDDVNRARRTLDATNVSNADVRQTPSPSAFTVPLGQQHQIEPNTPGPTVSPDLSVFATTDALSELSEAITDLLRELRSGEALPLARDLERRLRALPRRGANVRKGWIAVTELELHLAAEAKRRGKSIDYDRLNGLREEAKSVID